MNVSIYMKGYYEDFCGFGLRENKANSKPISESQTSRQGYGLTQRRRIRVPGPSARNQRRKRRREDRRGDISLGARFVQPVIDRDQFAVRPLHGPGIANVRFAGNK